MKMNIGLLIGLLVLGAVAGYLSGLIGIGGGLVVVPALVLLFGFSQYEAQGTSLAMMIPPIGIFAVMNYYKSGYVDWKFAALLIIGYIGGSILGSKMAISISQDTLKKIMAVLLVLVSLKLFFGK